MAARFVPVPLGTWETLVHRVFWPCHAVLAFVVAFYTTNDEVLPWIQHWLRPSSYTSSRKIDISDSEWWFYKANIVRILLCLSAHSLVFSASLRLSNRWLLYAAFLLQFCTHIALTSWPCVLTCSLLCAAVLLCSLLSLRESVSWLLSLLFILQCSRLAPFSNNSFVYYLEFNLYAYTCLKIINVSIYFARNPSVALSRDVVHDVLHYLLYLPFSVTLIVLFDDFRDQIQKRKAEIRSVAWNAHLTRSNALFGVRLVFWFLVLELLVHFIYANALFSSPDTLLYGMNSYQLMAVAYLVGQFFHLKYVVIFGVPALFARLDGMRPPPPPICVSRVSRYSRMWRHFDAGLYQFLKNQVYVPLLRGASGPAAVALRLLAIACVFLIVLVWHGFDSQYVFWVSLSALELVVEWVGAAIWSTQRFQRVRACIGERATRRAVALGMLGTVIPGIFGVFCFLGRAGIGTTIIIKVLWNGMQECLSLKIGFEDGIPTTGFILIHMLTLGYFFNNYTLDLEMQKDKIN